MQHRFSESSKLIDAGMQAKEDIFNFDAYTFLHKKLYSI